MISATTSNEWESLAHLGNRVTGTANTMAWGEGEAACQQSSSEGMWFQLEFSETRNEIFLIQVHGHPEFYPETLD